ncbi:hypothetical protein EJ03DRAFT_373566 [Teratosphaeria nubilosa]|uniref:Uncharacterized protein n=1 Tax=Teratosphaeria nubilosa TaxID=161662 RepID=A0A6G1LCU3_9PEZI|nr:hypothetical protein EJ03DRAFT_373566 [Teratosphaeria nubilosa]
MACPDLLRKLMHSPFPTKPQTAEAGSTIEAHTNLGTDPGHLKGLSSALRWLYGFATIKPAVVQNYELAIRAFCAEKGIVYQSFWTLTANPQLLRSKSVVDLAESVGVTSALSALVSGLGNVSILNGTTNARHMEKDLKGLSKVAAWASMNE